MNISGYNRRHTPTHPFKIHIVCTFYFEKKKNSWKPLLFHSFSMGWHDISIFIPNGAVGYTNNVLPMCKFPAAYGFHDLIYLIVQLL
jgi:hypothetical protein